MRYWCLSYGSMANQRYPLQFSLARFVMVTAVVPAAIAGLYWLVTSEDGSAYGEACMTGVVVGAVIGLSLGIGVGFIRR